MKDIFQKSQLKTGGYVMGIPDCTHGNYISTISCMGWMPKGENERNYNDEKSHIAMETKNNPLNYTEILYHCQNVTVISLDLFFSLLDSSKFFFSIFVKFLLFIFFFKEFNLLLKTSLRRPPDGPSDWV